MELGGLPIQAVLEGVQTPPKGTAGKQLEKSLDGQKPSLQMQTESVQDTAKHMAFRGH